MAIQIQEIMQLYAAGKSDGELSELFNVHQATIYRILKKIKLLYPLQIRTENVERYLNSLPLYFK